ncbi:MAG: TlpA family protein disulfide reductase [Bacteroidetes bacterium]|nr:TlpA family protein disulfide reductase [Bacteroidota bacterium]
MRKIILVILIVITSNLYAQIAIPSISLKNTQGKQINVEELTKEGLFIVSFWASWCVSCINELDEINDIYDEWQEKTKVKLIAVSIDDSRTIDRVIPLVNGKGWNYEILFDTNQDLKRNLNIGSVPYLMIVHNGKIVYRNSGYAPGQENEIFEELLKL